MDNFRRRAELIRMLPGFSTLFALSFGVFAGGCDDGPRDLFTTGFNCESPFHVNHDTCGLASGAITSSTSN